jgi:ADP-heptose:LPS heptosyltransferase
VPASAPSEEIRSARRILVARTDGLAGALLTGPLFRALRRACPEAQLAVLTDEGADEFYTAHPGVDARIVFHPTRAARDESCRRALIGEISGFAPDLILNPMYSSDSVTEELILSQPGARVIGFAGDAVKLTLAERHRAKRCYNHLLAGGGPHHSERARMQEFLKALGLEDEGTGAAPTPSIDAERSAQEFFLRTGLDPQRTIALCLSGSSDAPEYPHWEEALRALEGFQCLILGGSEVADRGDDLVRRLSGRAFNFAGRTNLPQMASLLRRCRLCVTSDPGVACLADALGVAHVVVAGGGDFGRYLPWSSRSTVACLPLECYGCQWRCRYETIHCLEHVTPEVVTEAMTGTLALARGSPRIYVPADSAGAASPLRPHRVSCKNVFGSGVEHIVAVVPRSAPDRAQAWGALAANM